MKETQKAYQKASSELRLVLAGAIGDIVKTDQLLQCDINWRIALQLSFYHGIYPLVYKTLKQSDNPAIPGGMLASLQARCRENTLHAVKMAGENIRMVNCLEGHGIRVIVLKGAALAHRLYGNITDRPSVDIDVLVSPNDLRKAGNVLECEGYRKVQDSREINSNPFHHVFWNREKSVVLELHCKLVCAPQVPSAMPADSEIRRIQLVGGSLPVLTDEAWLLYLILHGTSHAWSSARWLVDIAKFMRCEIDWEEIHSSAISSGAQSILYHALILANIVFAVPLPANYLPRISSDPEACRLSLLATRVCVSRSRIGRFYHRCLYDIHLLERWKRKLSYILSLFRPTVSDLGLISLPDRLYPLYYIVRPFTMAYRYFKN